MPTFKISTCDTYYLFIRHPITYLVLFFSSSVLFFSNSDNYGDIGRYNFTSATASQFVPSGKFPGDISVDGREQVVYWTNYVSNNEDRELLKTYYNLTTAQVRVYPGPIASIRLAQGEKYVYVLNPSRSALEIIDKETERVVETYTVKDATNTVAAAPGKCVIVNFIISVLWLQRTIILGSALKGVWGWNTPHSSISR